MRRLLAVAAACALLLAACGDDDEDVRTEPADDSETTSSEAPPVTMAEEVTMPVDLVAEVPAEIPAGQVELTLEAVNLGDDAVTLTFPSGQEGDAQLIDADGDVVYTWSATRSFIQVLQERTLAPGERFTVVLDADLSRVPAGSYTLELSLAVQDPPAPARHQIEITEG